MSITAIHDMRKELELAQTRMIRAYDQATNTFPAAPALAARCALHQAHDFLVPVAFALNAKIGNDFCKRWDAAIADQQTTLARSPS